MGSKALHALPPDRDDTRDALDAFRLVVQALRESSRAAQATVGLSGAQLFVLTSAAAAPGVSLRDLARLTRTHQSSVSTVAAALVRKGLLDRRAAADDARRAEMRVTAAGAAKLRRAPRAFQDRLIDAMDALPAGDRRQLARTLQRIARHMGLTGAPPMLFESHGDSRGPKRAHV
jgi:DNA-binding MarR family transcriptional regulator